MKFVNQSFEIIGTPKSLYEAWEYVAMAARNCYQSQKTRPDETEEQFCKRLLLQHEDNECNHMSPFEFGIVYLYIEYELDNLEVNEHYKSLAKRYYLNPYSKCKSRVIHTDEDLFNAPTDAPLKSGKVGLYITTNLRVIIENHWEDDLKYAGAPTDCHVKACMFRMVTSLHVYKDLTRHRTLSWAIESTRFCRYTSDKFGNGLTFIRPIKLRKYTDAELEINEEGYWNESQFVSKIKDKPREAGLILTGLYSDEYTYTHLINECGWTAQEAATKLPQDTKATVCMCGYEDDLKHFFRLRAEDCSGPVLPQVAEILKPMYEMYKKTNKTEGRIETWNDGNSTNQRLIKFN